MPLVINWIKKLLRAERGALLPSFAIITPSVLAIMTLGFDGANALLQKARLNNALDEATLALAAQGKKSMTSSELKEAEKMVSRYLKYHVPAIKTAPEIKLVSSQEQSESPGIKYDDYQISTQVKVPMIFDTGTMMLPYRDLEIGNNTKIRKFNSLPADYVFVVDFSTSQAGARLKTLKQVVKEISEFAITSNEETKIAVVPVSNGVPVLSGINERGGTRVSCSVLFVPTEEYDINYAFWADKYTSTNKDPLRRMYDMDTRRYSYYNTYVRTARPIISIDEMRKTWCVKNDTYGIREGKAQYSCKTELDPYTDIFSPASQRIIDAEYVKAYNAQKIQVTELSLLHDKSINYTATLNKMFSDEAIINFPLPWTSLDGRDHRPFDNMCRNGGWNNNSGDMSHAAPRSWLIELTNNLNTLAQFQDMIQEGWTQLSAGLIRSVPVMMKGQNRRKVFIMLSDGDDNAGKKVTEKWLKQYQLCQKIEEGLLARPQTNAKKVEIYYISTVTAASRVKLWAENCTGPDRAKTSRNREELIETIKGIMSDETGHLSI